MEQQKSKSSIIIAAIAAVIVTITMVMTAAITVVVPQAFAVSKSQGVVNGNGCEESGCPGHSLSSPGNELRLLK